MNKYNVCLARTICVDYEVIAESEEEAIAKAEELCDGSAVIYGHETYTDEGNTRVELLEENVKDGDLESQV